MLCCFNLDCLTAGAERQSVRGAVSEVVTLVYAGIGQVHSFLLGVEPLLECAVPIDVTMVYRAELACILQR